MRKLVVCWIVFLVLMASACDLSPPRNYVGDRKGDRKVSSDYRDRVQDAIALAEGEDLALARKKLAEVAIDTAFQKLSRSTQREVLSRAGGAAYTAKDYVDARNLYDQATKLRPIHFHDVYQLALLEAELDNHQEAARRLVQLVEQWPERVDELTDRYIFYVTQEIEPGSEVHLAVLQSLFDAEWNRRRVTASGLWFELASWRVERGQMDEAAKVIQRISLPIELIKLRSDRRFDTLLDSDATSISVERAAVQHANEMRMLWTDDQKDLEIATDLCDALLTIGAHQEVVAIADAIIEKIGAEPIEESAYTATDQYIWVLNQRAIALRHMGRTAEALVQLDSARQLEENGGSNVSQALNLALFYVDLERPEDALATVRSLGELSDYGRMVLAGVQYTAAKALSDEDAAQTTLQQIREQREDSSSSILVEALIKADLIDEAAQCFIEMLDEQDTRIHALLWIQEFNGAPSLVGSTKIERGRAALRAREDVRKAVDRVGRMGRYAIFY